MTNLVGVEGYAVYCPLIGKRRDATDCFIPGGHSCEHFAGLDGHSWRDENADFMVVIMCIYEAPIESHGGVNMAVQASDVKDIVYELLKECGFISTLHCEKGDHKWDQQLGPDPMVKAIITGFVYLAEVVDKRLATLIEVVKGEVR